jgi:DNA-binding transcriptional ArsR family regulator
MVACVASQSARLDDVFRALGDPTRRAVVHRLGKGESSVSELAAPFAMALPSFLQHLRVLEKSGLVRSVKVGRVRTYRLQRAPLEAAEKWMNEQRELWSSRLDRFDEYVMSLKKEKETPR